MIPLKKVTVTFEVTVMWGYFALMVIVLGLTSSAFGRVMVSMPFSNSAFALSETTFVGKATERWNEPQRCSRICQDLLFFSSSCFTSPLRVSTSPVTLICTSSALIPGREALTTISSSVWYISTAGVEADQPSLMENG